MKKKSNWFWLAIIGLVLAVCAALVAFRLWGKGGEFPLPTPTPVESGDPVESADPVESDAPLEIVGPVAVVYIGDYAVDAVDLGAITEAYTKVYEGFIDGASNTVEFKPGDVHVIEASCPDHVCIGQGWLIEDMGSILPIACLPNAMMINVISLPEASETPAVDGATQ